MVDTASFSPGTKLDDRVEVVELIGRGAMGCVYKARQAGVERAVAVKALHLTCLQDKDAVARFFREAKLVSTLDHPAIVKVYAVGMADDRQPFFVMDYIQGVTLAELIEQNEIDARRYIEIFSQIASALQHAHAHDVIHRDIKPKNVLLVNEDGKLQVKLVDFGIARTLQPDNKSGQKITKTGAIIGSPTYMSPEQCTGRPVDHRTDIYSLGCVMYEAATGSVPFQDEDAVGLIGKHVFEEPQPIHSRIRIKDFPKGLADVVMVALRKEPASRYQSAESMLRDLESAKMGQPLSVAPNIVQKRARVRRSEPRSAVVSTIIVMSMALLAGWFLIRAYAMKTQHTNDSVGRAVALSEKALYLSRFKRDYAQALAAYAEAYDIYSTTGRRDKTLAQLCAGRARCNAQLGAFSPANKFFGDALGLETSMPEKDVAAIGDLYRDWGISLMKEDRYVEAGRKLQLAYDNYKIKSPGDNVMLGVVQDLIKMLEYGQDFQRAADLYPELISLEQKSGYAPIYVAQSMDEYANLLQKMAKTQEAAVQRKAAKALRETRRPHA